MEAEERKVLSGSADRTRQLAGEMAGELGRGDVVALVGELGAGKTCFIQGLCAGLGVEERVTSPSFVLLHEYSGRLPIYHFDAYRLDDADQFWDLGAPDYLDGDGICLVEWADRVRSMLPDHTRWVRLELVEGEPDSRMIYLPAFRLPHSDQAPGDIQ